MKLQQIISVLLFLLALVVALFSVEWAILIMLIAVYVKPTAPAKVNIQPQVTKTVTVGKPYDPREKYPFELRSNPPFKPEPPERPE